MINAIYKILDLNRFFFNNLLLINKSGAY